MCGIAGLVVPPDTNFSLHEHGEIMRDALTHRGPDSQGIWVNEQEGLVMAHNRLAIQDLSEQGHQPMWSPSGRYCIVFNGEIYNFKELAEELSAAGCHFSGHSDTEVLLNAIDKWGLQKAIQKSVGMFSLSIWDARERTLSFCRDRLGEKPLYYGWLNNCFCFASELKAIEAIAPQKNLEICQPGLLNYLRYGYISAPYSIYKDIYKLIPGTILSFPITEVFDRSDYSPFADKSTPGPTTYWSAMSAANYGLNNPINNEDEAIMKLESLLHSTVKMQTIADVGIGVFLSGGIDSSTVAAIAQHNSTDKIKTFSIGFSEKEYDESLHAEKIAEHLGTDHSTINVTARDSLQIIPKLPSMFDEPFADSSQIPTYIVSEFARRKITVCLSGDGGDELFAGYNRYLSTDSIWRKVSPIPFPLRKLLGKAISTPTPKFWDGLYNGFHKVGRHGKEKQKLVGLKLQKLSGLMQQQDIMCGYDYLLSYWNQPEDIVSFDRDTDKKNLKQELPSSTNFINRAMFLDQTGYLPGDNLTKVDRASMAISLETRLPLLSHELFEMSWRIPVSMKVRDNTSKWILRQVLYKYVPRNLIERPKMGFSVPVAQWLRSDLKTWADNLLGLIGTNGYEFLRKEPIISTWHEHLSGRRDHSQRLWTILMLLAWKQERTR